MNMEFQQNESRLLLLTRQSLILDVGQKGKMMKRSTTACLFALFGVAIAAAAFAAESSVPERLAAHYYAKLRDGDMATVARCIDPDDLALFKEKLIPVFDAGFFASLPPEALQVLTRGDRLTVVKNYPPDKLFERFMELIGLLQPQFKEVLAQSEIEIIGSIPERANGKQTVHVLARITPRTGADARVPVVVLTARLHDRTWRLLVPQDINQVVEMLHAQAMAQGSVEESGQRLIDAGPDTAHSEIMNMLSAGKQADAEEMLAVLVGAFPEDQPLAFAQAVCSRSRWAKSRAAWQFRRVMELAPSTVEGKAARYMLDLDARKMVADNMNGLRILIQQNPKHPLLLWLMGMACQDNFKHTGETTYAKEGERSYRALLNIWNVGPVLLHQTFANILSEQLSLMEEALKHRQVAAELEPAGWTYQGLANTLTMMERYDEADRAFAKLMELAPDDAEYWWNWALMLSKAGRYEDCIEKCRKSTELDPTYVKAYRTWAWALDQLGKNEEALAMYMKVITITPNDFIMYNNAAAILRRLGRNEEAAALLEERNKLPGW